MVTSGTLIPGAGRVKLFNYANSYMMNYNFRKLCTTLFESPYPVQLTTTA